MTNEMTAVFTNISYAKEVRIYRFISSALSLLILRNLVSGPMHGYGSARRLKQVSEDVLRVGEGSLYPALQPAAGPDSSLGGIACVH